MISRVARFPGQPERFTTGHGYRYVIETLRETPGCIACYHLTNDDESVSISIWEDTEAMTAGEVALAAVRDRLGVESRPPTDVVVFDVAAATL
jgi:hypothetical protein